MITLDGVKLTDMGIIPLKDHVNPLTSRTRDNTLEIPNRHGLYDFGAYMEQKDFRFPLGYYPNTRAELQRKIYELKTLLFDTYGRPKTIKLELDYEEEKWYMVRFSGSIPIERLLSMGEFTLPLTAYDPWAYAPADYYDPDFIASYDTDAEYNEGLEYKNQTFSPFDNTRQYVGVYNYSHYVTPFSFVIEGRVDNPKLTNVTTGKSITFNGLSLASNERLYVDCKKKTTWKIKATEDQHYWLTPNMMMEYPSQWEKLNVYHEMNGDWIDLASGGNTLLFEGNNPNASINFQWLHRFM